MKRIIVALFAVAALVAASTVSAQVEMISYPPQLAGEPLDLDQVETSMICTVARYFDSLPYSAPNPLGLQTQVMISADSETLILIDQRLGRLYSMAWVEDCGCYAAWTFPRPDRIRFVAVVGTSYPEGAWTAVFWDGQLAASLHPPFGWEFDTAHPLLAAQINPEGVAPGVVIRRPEVMQHE